MIKRLDLLQDRHRTPEWPEPERGLESTDLFKSRSPHRKLVVMIDHELLPGAAPSSEVNPNVVLGELLEHPYIDVYRFSDDGPPPSVVPRAKGPFSKQVHEGWAVLEDREPRDGVWHVTLSTANGYALGGVMGNAPEVAEHDTAVDAYPDLGADDAASQRRADALAAEVASQALQADIYVTDRPYLHAATWSVARGVTLCRPAEAVALVGLYLRAQGEFWVASRYTFNRGLYYWVGTRELLPAAWRWFSACVAHASATGDDSMTLLGGSLLQRVDRALEARDAIHVALNQRQNNDLQDDALSSLDAVLFQLMGAVDVAARVTHRVLDIQDDEYRAAWQRGAWLQQVRDAHPPLAAAIAPLTPHAHALTIVRLLRNSVHGAALQGIAVLRGGEPMQSLLGLPATDEAEILEAMRSLDGEASWGVTPEIGGRTHVDPGALVDRLFVATIRMLNDLMVLTPVEWLPGVNGDALRTGPPEEDDSPFAEWVRKRIQLHLGF